MKPRLDELLKGKRIIAVDESNAHSDPDEQNSCHSVELTLDDGTKVLLDSDSQFCPGDCNVFISYEAKP